MDFLKRIAAQFPLSWQQEIRRYRCRNMIRRSSFQAGEPEFERLRDWIRPGDCVIDVGANIGNYTLRMSQLAGPTGHVIAFEPVPENFWVLLGNLNLAPYRNITPVNVAASDELGLAYMRIPSFNSGLRNYYQAALISASEAPTMAVIEVMKARIDDLGIQRRVSLVKVDTEGHEESVIDGMWGLIQRDQPALIIENPNQVLTDRLLNSGYSHSILPDSPNAVFIRHDNSRSVPSCQDIE